MFINELGQHVSNLTESSSGSSKNTDPYLATFKTRCGISNAYILDKTMYKMHVSLSSYSTIEIPNFKTLTGTYERGYTMYLRCVVIELSIVLYIYIYIYIYI